MNVAIIGASNKPDRYSNQALHLLAEYGHTPYPIHPAIPEIDGTATFKHISEITDPIHTVTMYVSPAHSTGMAPDIIAAKPKRVIFNPGTENPELETAITDAGIEVVKACTLVMLRTNQVA